MESKFVGKRIRSIRLEKGQTMEEFGELLATSKGTVNNWEKGRNLPNKERLFQIAKIGGITVEELLTGQPSQNDLVKIESNFVGKRIKKIRMSKGMTLEEFGNLFHAGKSNVSVWEKGSSLPNKERLVQIAKIGGITVEELLTGQPSLDDLVKSVEKWSEDRGLHKADYSKQALKTVEEVGETVSCLLRNDIDGFKDGIGDILVTVIILAQQKGTNVAECLEIAYDEIKERTGKMIDGTFVKSSDLD